MPRFSHVALTGSTNDDLMAAAAAGAGEGEWIIAERQEGGRGRQGRVWSSPPGNLYASTLVRVQSTDPPAATLALVAAVALEQVVAAYAGAGTARLKWPNDLMAGEAKLSGILLERSGDAVVIGFGVNLAHHPTDLERPATSLAAIAGSAPDPAVFVRDLGDAMVQWLGRWRGEGIAPVRTRWLERAHPVGTAIVARTADGGATEGLFDGLGADGALMLRLADGGVRAIHAGDVFLI